MWPPNSKTYYRHGGITKRYQPNRRGQPLSGWFLRCRPDSLTANLSTSKPWPGLPPSVWPRLAGDRWLSSALHRGVVEVPQRVASMEVIRRLSNSMAHPAHHRDQRTLSVLVGVLILWIHPLLITNLILHQYQLIVGIDNHYQSFNWCWLPIHLPPFWTMVHQHPIPTIYLPWPCRSASVVKCIGQSVLAVGTRIPAPRLDIATRTDTWTNSRQHKFISVWVNINQPTNG